MDWEAGADNRVFRYRTTFVEGIISSMRHWRPFLLLLNTTGLFQQPGHVSWLAARTAAELGNGLLRSEIHEIGNQGRDGPDTSDLGVNIYSCSLSFLVNFCSAKTNRFFFPAAKTWSYLRCSKICGFWAWLWCWLCTDKYRTYGIFKSHSEQLFNTSTFSRH